MIRALKWLYGLVFQNFAWKLLSLAIAVAIWAMVASEPEMGTMTPVQLGYKNLPDDLEISSKPETTILLELRGPSVLLREAHPTVILDLSRARPGLQAFLIGRDSVNVTSGVNFVRAVPSEVRFDFEPRDTKDVPVEVRFSGAGDNDYAIAHYEVSPSRLEIIGPKSRVSRVEHAETDPVDVSAAVGTYSFRVNAFVNDPYVRFEHSPQVTVTVTMKKK